MKSFCLFIGILFACIIGQTSSLRCINCSLSEQFRCASNVINLPKHKCHEPNMTLEEKETLGVYPVCIKTTKPSKKPNSTYPYTGRTCGWFDGQKDNCDELIAKELKETGDKMSCFVCTKDLCNVSSFISMNAWIVLVAAVFGVASIRR